MSWIANEHDSEWPFELLATDFQLSGNATALLIIDMQGSCLTISPESELGAKYPKIARYWNDRIEHVLLPNIGRLLDSFRRAGRRVVYTRNGPLTPHASEETVRLRRRIKAKGGARRYPGSVGFDVMEAIGPQEGELVVDKLTSGGFNCSILDHALRNMGVRDVVIAGIATDMCVFGTARVAAELGYNALICEDACATYTAAAQEAALLMHARVFGRVASTDDVLVELGGS